MTDEYAKHVVDSFKDFAVLDKTKYAVVLTAPISGSGKNEILARFFYKKDAEQYMRDKGLRLGSGYYIRKLDS